jgi:nicotinate-nucleotide pyrophosphorylase (carboxylating)
MNIRHTIEAWVAEDVGRGDRTTESLVPVDAVGRARIEARGKGVIAGAEAARICFEAAGGEVAWRPVVGDGQSVPAGALIAHIEGRLRTILTGERTALNLLSRLSGIATLTREFVAAIEGTPARVVDTRKTTPGLRMLEKHAVRAGGGNNHRFGLDDGVLIKDNHIAAVGSVTEAVRRARGHAPHGLMIEIEVSDLDELDEAVAAGADAVLLDNMSPTMVREAVTRAGGKVVLEASGGISLHNVRAYAEAGVDLISIGALTHSAPAVDVALELEDPGHGA